MFSSLFGKKEKEDKDQLFRDRAFMTSLAKMNDCVKIATENEHIIFIAWFSETADQFKKYFIENGLTENRIFETTQISASGLSDKTVVFVEHYPMHTTEENLALKWNFINTPVYSAMDEPLFKHFGSEKLIPVMKMLGMKENEVIEHSMVSKSIINGQHKIEDQVKTEQPATSQAEWMQKNLPANQS